MIRQTLLAVLSAAALGAYPGTAATAAAQAPGGQKTSDTIPREYRPPAGMCRIWVEGVPPGQQPAPTDCPTAVKNKPANGKVIYGETRKGNGKSLDRLPVKGFIKPPERKGPPLIPPDQEASAPPDRQAWENNGI